MSGECEDCGSHTLECRCKRELLAKSANFVEEIANGMLIGALNQLIQEVQHDRVNSSEWRLCMEIVYAVGHYLEEKKK